MENEIARPDLGALTSGSVLVRAAPSNLRLAAIRALVSLPGLAARAKDWMADDGDCDGNFSASNYSFLDTDPDGECGGESFTVDAKFVAGCACSLVGTVCLNLGINVQKWGLTHEGRRPAHLRRPMVKNPRWILGFLIFCVSNAGDFLGLSLAPQTVIMAVGTASIVSNMIFGRCALPASPAPCVSATQGRVS